MSSAVEKSGAASGDQKFVDFDEFVDYQLRKTRTEIKQTDVLTGLVGVAVVVLGYLLAFVLLDQWVIEGGFSPAVRMLMLAVLVLGVGAWMVRRLVWPYFHHVTELYAARELEQSDPGLKSTLLTLVDLRRAGRPIPHQLKTAMEKRGGRQPLGNGSRARRRSPGPDAALVRAAGTRRGNVRVCRLLAQEHVGIDLAGAASGRRRRCRDPHSDRRH